MVISFSSPLPRTQLLEKGIVYTFRKTKRKQLGKTWANEGRLKPKICDVFIEEVGQFRASRLEPYVEWSGFESLGNWYGEIVRLNKGWDIDQMGWLYRVRIHKSEDTTT